MDDYKITILYGNNDSVKNIKKGTFENIGNMKTDTDIPHIQLFLDYINNLYKDVKMFDILNERHSPETAAFLISRLGNIVFLNITKEHKKYGKLGIFIMPDHIDYIMQEQLLKLSETIKDFSISIYYDLEVKDGLLDSKIISFVDSKTPKEVLTAFFKKNNENEITKHL